MIYQYLLAAIPLIIPALFGIALLAYTNIFRERVSIVTIGSIFGIALFGTLSYALGHAFPLTRMLLVTQFVIMLGFAIALLVRGGIKNIKNSNTDKTAVGLFFLFLILFSIIGPKLLIQKQDGLYTGIINAYGDIGWHTAIIMEIAERKTLPLEDPLFAGHNLTYPYLANLISSAMVILGASLDASVNIPAILLIPILLVLMYFFAKQYGASQTAGAVACFLFLFGGATLGFIRLPQDFIASGYNSSHFLVNLPVRNYSGVGSDTDGFHFLNPITSLLLPQRAMLFGIPLVLSIITLLHPNIFRRKYAPLIAGIMTGMLPLFHAHACIALSFAIVGLFIISPHKKRFILFVIPALAIGIPELSFYIGGESEQGSFFRYGPGWMAQDRSQIIYWLQNTGLLIPLSLIGLASKAPKTLKALIGAGSVLFILADTFLFAPWAWDNFKLFVFWLIFILPSIGYISNKAIHHSKHIIVPIIACSLLLLHMLSAGLDIWKLALPNTNAWGEWTKEAVLMANIIQNNVPVREPVLTAPVHNSPATLAGRTLVLGYPAHVWSHGALPWNREKEVKEYFAGTRNIIENATPRYILIGPQERSAFPNLIIRPQWQEVISSGPYTLFFSPS